MDRDPQTAEELHALVSQWPKEAKQIGLDFNDYENGYRPHWTLDHGTREFCPLNYAIDLHTASGLRWLMEHENTDALTIIPAADKSAHFRIEMDLFRDPSSRNRNDRCSRTFDAPTLFLALHAAILAEKEST